MAEQYVRQFVEDFIIKALQSLGERVKENNKRRNCCRRFKRYFLYGCKVRL